MVVVVRVSQSVGDPVLVGPAEGRLLGEDRFVEHKPRSDEPHTRHTDLVVSRGERGV